MSSNKKTEQLPTLYLKEFFGRYFERKEMLEVISHFSNGLKVLEILIENFERTQGIKQISKIHNYSQLGTDFLSDVNREGRNINLILESIYDRLQNIFDHWPCNRQQQSDYSLKNSRKCSSFAEEDDELYDMLNKYKNDFKKQKTERIAAEKQVTELHVQIQKLTEENKLLTDEIKRNDLSFKTLKQKAGDFQTLNSVLKQQVDDFQSKIEEYMDMQAAFTDLKADFQLLSLKYSQSQERQKLLTEKFNAIDGIVHAKILANQQKWNEMITKKMNSTDIYSNPACKVLKSLVKALNKENIESHNSL